MKNFQKGFVVPLLIGIIALLVIGGGVYIYKNKKVEVPVVVDTGLQQSNQVQQTNNQTLPVINQQQQNSSIKNCSNAGMSIRVPNESKYECNTEVARAVGNGAVALNVSYKNNSSSISSNQVVSMYKFSNQVLFNESAPQGSSSDFTLINSNYSISGTTGSYYNRNPSSGGGNMIIVPSKLIIISIDPASYIGISQTTLDSIVTSISF